MGLLTNRLQEMSECGENFSDTLACGPSVLHFCFYHMLMVRAELRETRSPEEANWYFAFDVLASTWAIANMHWAWPQFKINFYLMNLYVTFT